MLARRPRARVRASTGLGLVLARRPRLGLGLVQGRLGLS